MTNRVKRGGDRAKECGYTPHIATMNLADLLAAYVESRLTSLRYRESLTRSVKKAVAAGLSSVADFEPAKINRLLVNLSTPSPTTKHNIRRELLTLWRFAYEQHFTDEPPLRVMRIKAAAKAPQAWSLAELSRMLDCAESDETAVGGVSTLRVSDYMPAWVCVAYDSGLRFSDLLALKSENIRNGFIVTTAQKTGKSLTRPLSAYSLKQLARLIELSPDGSVFSWFLTRRRAILTMRAFLKRHGFNGSTKYLRRSCATYVEANSPGAASRYLQHSQPNLVHRHYLDESLLSVPSGPPPIKPVIKGHM